MTADLPGWRSQGVAGKGQEYSREDVAEHSTRENRVWVTYKDGVYDVTGIPHMHSPDCPSW
jgi:hypothetical protein